VVIVTDEDRRREILQRAYETLDRVEHVYVGQHEDTLRRAADALDALESWRATMPEQLNKQAPDRGLIFKENDEALVPPPPEDTTMDADLARHFERVAFWIGSELGAIIKQGDNGLSARLDDMQSQIDELSARVAALEADDSAARSNVVPMLELKGGRNAA